MDKRIYAYRVLSDSEADNRINEARDRGWEVHSMSAGPISVAILFEFDPPITDRTWHPPFASEEEETEEPD